MAAAAVALAAVTVYGATQTPLALTKIDPADSPMAKCIDGTPPAYYWRDGVGADADKAVLFLEGGGWCYPSDMDQTSGANCAVRARSGLGSSARYPPTIPSTGYEGGSGFLSGDPSNTAWANWAVSYVKYCDGGSMTGTRESPTPARNGSTGSLYYRGHYNIQAQLDSMVAKKGLGSFKEIVLSGCSAGGMACYLKCDFVASYFEKHGAQVKCICDAGMFLDVDTVTGAGQVMETRYHDIAEVMESKPGLSPACVAGEADWRQCMFSQHTLKYQKTATFVINSLYNFGEWAMLTPQYNGTFPPDTGTPPPDWTSCYPGNGRLSPASYQNCNATQKAIIQGFRKSFIAAAAPAIDANSPHGIFVDSCPNMHCQTSVAWNKVLVDGLTMAEAASRWYFNHTSEKHVDLPFAEPTVNPTCGYNEGLQPMCNNCANAGLGSNCLWDPARALFHGLDQN